MALEAAAPGAGDRSVTTLGETMRHDGREWEVVRVNLPIEGVQPGKYLLDPATKEVAYLVDPGIGGRIREIDGRPITKLDSPKATIMALVTDGILTQKLPWGLVLIGVCLTIAIEIMGLQSLPIAVGRLSADLDLGLDVHRRGHPLAGGAQAHERRVAGRGGVGPRGAVLQRTHRRGRDRGDHDRRHRGDDGGPGRRGGGPGSRVPGPCRRSAGAAGHRSPRATSWPLVIYAGLGYLLYRVASR